MQSGNRVGPGIVGLALLGALALALLGVMAYSSLRRSAARLSCDFYYPYLRLVSKTESSFAAESLMLRDKLTLAKAVDRLQADNAELSSRVTQLALLEKENARLRDLLSMPARGSFKPVYAEVIARDPASWYERFTIGKGLDDGLDEGDLVVCPALSGEGGKLVPAAVGRLKAVSRHTASVYTLASEECKLSVALPDSGVAGLLQGSGLLAGVPAPAIKFLPLRPAYKAGDAVFTSGASNSTPPSIFVGRLCAGPGGAVAEERDHIYAEARLLPAVDFEAIRFVSVFTRARK